MKKSETFKVGKYTVHIVEENEPGESAIRNTNRKVNEIMNKYYSKLDHKDKQCE
ncbi:hypothetical protein MKZ26_20170 [Sporosarcina sp. FSL K6-6792]|uniref:hypothetical protein n=1 Tax=Sporosarcina sp. FSL K6-6792 TaxID=2921559 RepID=UPI0030F8E57C